MSRNKPTGGYTVNIPFILPIILGRCSVCGKKQPKTLGDRHIHPDEPFPMGTIIVPIPSEYDEAAAKELLEAIRSRYDT